MNEINRNTVSLFEKIIKYILDILNMFSNYAFRENKKNDKIKLVKKNKNEIIKIRKNYSISL